MTSPFDRYQEYFQLTGEVADYVKDNFSGFFGALTVILGLLTVIGIGFGLVWIIQQTSHKLHENGKYSKKKMQVAVTILVVSILVASGYSIIIYRFIHHTINVETIIEGSGYEPMIEDPDYIPPEDTVWE